MAMKLFRAAVLGNYRTTKDRRRSFLRSGNSTCRGHFYCGMTLVMPMIDDIADQHYSCAALGVASARVASRTFESTLTEPGTLFDSAVI
jgi:hypothetical protein